MSQEIVPLMNVVSPFRSSTYLFVLNIILAAYIVIVHLHNVAYIYNTWRLARSPVHLAGALVLDACYARCLLGLLAANGGRAAASRKRAAPMGKVSE